MSNIVFENNVEKHLLPNGEEVLFDALEHRYFVKTESGLYEVPSVSALLDKVFGNPYGFVNPDVLQRAANYGTAIHEELRLMIEARQECPDIPLTTDHQETHNYFEFVEPIYKITPDILEKVVVLYNESGEPFGAGRFDMLGYLDGKQCLFDFKTTSTVDKQRVTGQLNLYLKAATQSGYDINPEISLGVIHLSGQSSRFIKIPVLGENFYKKFL